MSYDHMTLTCPHCQRAASGVVETRAHQNVVYRRRVCRACKGRFTTAEQVTGSAGIKGTIKQLEIERGVATAQTGE